jgi:hypothetical protein
MNELQTKEVSQPTVVIPLKDLVGAYVEARDKIKALDEEYDKAAEPLKTAKESIRLEIIRTLKDRQEFSARMDKATVSLSVRKTAVIIDEKVLVAELKKKKLKDYFEPRVTELFKDSILKEMAKSGELMAGCAITESEFISVRSNDKEDARKIVTEPYVQLNK